MDLIKGYFIVFFLFTYYIMDSEQTLDMDLNIDIQEELNNIEGKPDLDIKEIVEDGTKIEVSEPEDTIFVTPQPIVKGTDILKTKPPKTLKEKKPLTEKQKAHMIRMTEIRTQKKLEKQELLRLKGQDKETKKAKRLQADSERKAEIELLREKKQKDKEESKKTDITKTFEKQVGEREKVARYSKEQHEQLKFMDFMTQMERYEHMKNHFTKKQSNHTSPSPVAKPKPQPKKKPFNPVLPPTTEEPNEDYIWFG